MYVDNCMVLSVVGLPTKCCNWPNYINIYACVCVWVVVWHEIGQLLGIKSQSENPPNNETKNIIVCYTFGLYVRTHVRIYESTGYMNQLVGL